MRVFRTDIEVAAATNPNRRVRLDNVNIAKGAGTVTGAAFVGWDSTYSFNADGRHIPVDRMAGLAYPRAPLSGLRLQSAGL